MKDNEETGYATKAGECEEHPGGTAIYTGLYDWRVFHYDGIAIDIIRTDFYSDDFSGQSVSIQSRSLDQFPHPLFNDKFSDAVFVGFLDLQLFTSLVIKTKGDAGQRFFGYGIDFQYTDPGYIVSKFRNTGYGAIRPYFK